MTAKTPKAAKKKADDLFSLIVRSLGYCERCGYEGRMETSHWISRRYAWTRTYEANAFCFCSSCHRWWHNYPTDASDWAIGQRGRDTWEHIRERSYRRDKFDWFTEVERLSQMVG